MFKRLTGWFKNNPSQILAEPSERIALLEKNLGFSIPEKDVHFFTKALRHRSIVDNDKYEPYETYERLEFLGDAVLDLIVTELLFDRYPTENEGYLTKFRSKIVKGDTLSIMAKKLALNEVLEVGERATGQGIELSKSVLADVYEAVIAAIYLSQGYEKTYNFVKSNIDKLLDIDLIETKVDNYKSLLMEYTQSEKIPLPEYKIISEDGPGHDKTFVVAVFLSGKKRGQGEGKSKKQAEQAAAKKALHTLGINN
jgi:ribonuclease III